MDIKALAAYFVIGGLIVSAVTYFGNQAKSELAAFIAFLPSISVITLCTIYFASGTGADLLCQEYADTTASLAAICDWGNNSPAPYRPGRVTPGECCRLFSRGDCYYEINLVGYWLSLCLL